MSISIKVDGKEFLMEIEKLIKHGNFLITQIHNHTNMKNPEYDFPKSDAIIFEVFIINYINDVDMDEKFINDMIKNIFKITSVTDYDDLDNIRILFVNIDKAFRFFGLPSIKYCDNLKINKMVDYKNKLDELYFKINTTCKKIYESINTKNLQIYERSNYIYSHKNGLNYIFSDENCFDTNNIIISYFPGTKVRTTLALFVSMHDRYHGFYKLLKDKTDCDNIMNMINLNDHESIYEYKTNNHDEDEYNNLFSYCDDKGIRSGKQSCHLIFDRAFFSEMDKIIRVMIFKIEITVFESNHQLKFFNDVYD